MKSISNKKFTKTPIDKYYTHDVKAHKAINRFLPREKFTFIEPCAGSR